MEAQRDSSPLRRRMPSTKSLQRKLAQLTILEHTPLLGRESLAIASQASLRATSRNLIWFRHHGLIESYLPATCGSGNEYLYYLSKDGLTLLSTLTDPTELTAPPSPRPAVQTHSPLERIHQHYRHTLRRLLPRIPHYVQLQELGDSLAHTWYQQYRVSSTDDQRPSHMSGETAVTIKQSGHVARMTSGRTTIPRWNWCRDHRLTYHADDRDITCRVDALAWTQDTTEPMLLIIYLDDGIRSIPQISRVLKRLLEYRHEQSLLPEEFPPVLVSSPSRHRAAKWAQAAQTSAQDLGLDPLHGFLLYPNDQAVQSDLSVPDSDEETFGHQSLPPWPPTQDGLPTSEVPDTQIIRDFTWQLVRNDRSLQQGHHSDPAAHIRGLLFQPTTTEIFRTMTSTLPPARLTSPKRLSPQAHSLLTSLPPAPSHPGKRSSSLLPPPRGGALWEATTLLRIASRIQQLATSWTSLNRSQQHTIIATIISCLERRQIVILALIAAHPVITLEDLATLLHVDRLSLTIRLTALRQTQLIEQLTLPAPATGFPSATWEPLRTSESGPPAPLTRDPLHCLRLSPLGFDVLGAIYGVPASYLEYEQRHERRITAHDAGIRHFLALLASQAQHLSQQNTHHTEKQQLNAFHTLEWINAPAVLLQFPTAGETVTVVPDATAEFDLSITDDLALSEHPTRPKSNRHVRCQIWLEWDAGTENTRDLWDKFHAYQQYAEYVELEDSTHPLPALLVVVPEDHQEQRILRILTELALRQHPQQHQHATRQPATRAHRDEPGMETQRRCWWISQTAATLRSPAAASREPSRRLDVYLTTTSHLAHYGPLGPCWLRKHLY